MEFPRVPYHTWNYSGRVGQDLNPFSRLRGAFYEDVEIVNECIWINSEMFYLSWFPQDGAWTQLAPNRCCIADFVRCGCMGYSPQARWEVGVHTAKILFGLFFSPVAIIGRGPISPQAALSSGRTPCNYGRFSARSVRSQTNQGHQHLLPLSPDFNVARHPTLIVFEGAARHRKGIECFDEISRHFPGSC